MTWTTPKTWAAGDVLSASDLNTYVRDNTGALLSRVGSGIQYDNGADYTTTSDTFTPIDSTNLSMTLTTVGTKLMVGFSGVCPGTSMVSADYDITIDGTRISNAGANGLMLGSRIGNTDFPVNFTAVKTGLAPGSHTIQVVWKRHTAGAGTCTLYSGNGTAGQDFIPSFWAMEVG